MTPALAACAALLLAACAPPYSAPTPEPLETVQQREARLVGAAPLTPFPTEAETIAADARAVLGATGAAPFDPVAAPGPVVPVQIATLDVALDRDNPSISREQDFEAVSAERDIAADAERMAAARAQREEIAPEALERPDDVGPNVFAYALGPARDVGSTGAYARGLRASADRARTACAAYSSADLAQAAFMEAGGPERDRLGLDPDGDGNACSWDPSVVRSAVRR